MPSINEIRVYPVSRSIAISQDIRVSIPIVRVQSRVEHHLVLQRQEFVWESIGTSEAIGTVYRVCYVVPVFAILGVSSIPA